MTANSIEKPLHCASSPRILVMDDEDTVRGTLCRMLGAMGYGAEGARDGSEALAIFNEARAEGRPFSVVILDLAVRDGLGGAATLAALRQVDPEVRAVASTGSGFESEQGFHSLGFSAALCKPYSMAELDSVIARLLERDGS